MIPVYSHFTNTAQPDELQVEHHHRAPGLEPPRMRVSIGSDAWPRFNVDCTLCHRPENLSWIHGTGPHTVAVAADTSTGGDMARLHIRTAHPDLSEHQR